MLHILEVQFLGENRIMQGSTVPGRERIPIHRLHVRPIQNSLFNKITTVMGKIWILSPIYYAKNHPEMNLRKYWRLLTNGKHGRQEKTTNISGLWGCTQQRAAKKWKEMLTRIHWQCDRIPFVLLSRKTRIFEWTLRLLKIFSIYGNLTSFWTGLSFNGCPITWFVVV